LKGLIVDLFAGGGGASAGIEAALGRSVDIAINHSATALAVHAANHPRTRHMTADIWEVNPRDATGGQPVELLWASPDCTHFSIAKGNVPRRQDIRSLADVVIDWARDVRPRMIFLENVQEFQGWGPLGADGRPDKSRKGEDFRRWVGAIQALGYVVDWRVLDSSQYGTITRRRRLFLVARCDGQPIAWPRPTHGAGLGPLHTAAECIDWSLPCPSIFDRKKPLAEKTHWRVAQGIRKHVFECAAPFIVKVNHGKWEARTADLWEPLSTITAERRGDALVVPTLVQTGYGERPGQAPRVPGLHKPLGTAVDGQKHALVAAWLVKHFGDPLRESGGGIVTGSDLSDPIGAVTARDHHSIAAVTLAKFNGNAANGHPGCRRIDEPLDTITSGGGRGGGHIAEVRAFLTAYYGSDGPGGQQLTEPLRTITAKHRLGLVTVLGYEWQLSDIGLRMLEPHELLRAQFGRFADAYDLSAAPTKAGKVKLIGNSVCPEVAEVLVRANFDEQARRAA
jgi:DNA (cytosine-5)-methyltransferase 1